MKLNTYELAWGGAVRSELLVLLCLARYADRQTHVTYVTAPTIATDTGIDERHVRRILAALAAAGAIDVVERGGGRARSNRYRLTGRRVNPDARASVSKLKNHGSSVRVSGGNPDISSEKPGHFEHETLTFRALNPDARAPRSFLSGRDPVVDPSVASDAGKPIVDGDLFPKERETSAGNIDIKAVIFGAGLAWMLANGGGPDRTLRSFLAKLASKHGDHAVAAALVRIQSETPKPVEPRSRLRFIVENSNGTSRKKRTDELSVAGRRVASYMVPDADG